MKFRRLAITLMVFGVLAGLVVAVRAQTKSRSRKSSQESPKPVQPLRVSGNTMERNLIYKAEPVYPPLARSARIQGMVVLEVTIAQEGDVEEVRLISGHPLLVQATMDAVKKYRYRPTYLNGVPVEVISSVTVNFTLAVSPPPEVKRTSAEEEASKHTVLLAREGYRISAEDAKRMEADLRSDPEKLDERIKLLAFYFSNGPRLSSPASAIEARRRHILWLIENHPEAPVTELGEATIDPAGHPLADKEGYEQARKLWLEQTDSQANNLAVLKHAAKFFQLPDKELAASLLKRGLALVSGNQELAGRLGYLYGIGILGLTGMNQNGFPTNFDPAETKNSFAKLARYELNTTSDTTVLLSATRILMMYGSMFSSMDTTGKFKVDYQKIIEEILKNALDRDPSNSELKAAMLGFHNLQRQISPSSEARVARAKEMLEQQEKNFNSMTDKRQRFAMTFTMASNAFAAGDMKKAELYAREAIETAPQFKDLWTAYVLNPAHLILGRVALRASDIERAKLELLEAGKVPKDGSTQQFSPGMALAKELLEKGERDVVMQYLDLCSAFWSGGKEALERWKGDILAGRIPDFPVGSLHN